VSSSKSLFGEEIQTTFLEELADSDISDIWVLFEAVVWCSHCVE
jgi:hypothetical protein